MKSRFGLGKDNYSQSNSIITEIIKHNHDRIMIVDLGPQDGKAEERIEFLGVHPSNTESKAVVV